MTKAICGDWYNLPGILDRFERYQAILADPPWKYNDQKKERKDTKVPTKGIGACHHYPGIPTADLCKFKIADLLAADRCMLWFWAVAPMLPDALQVMAAWEFEYVTVGFVWLKLNKKAWKDVKIWERAYRETAGIIEPTIETIRGVLNNLTRANPGYYTMSNVELLLLGRKGQAFRHAAGHKARQVVYAEGEIAAVQDGEFVFSPLLKHSEKPRIFQDLIVDMYPHADPRLEIFAREPYPGWSIFGNEIEEARVAKQTASINVRTT